MAHSSAMNSLTEALVSSFVPAGGNTSRLRRARDNFARRLKHHNFGRTNQFQVAERLNEVQEKFQILSHDDLSDSLRSRLNELKSHENQWLPDVLDLLLRLTNNPAGMRNVDVLQKVRESAEPPPPLKWSEIEADDPVDRDDPIWQVQEYSDLSSDEDVSELSSEQASPKNTKPKQQNFTTDTAGRTFFIPVGEPAGPSPLLKLQEAQFWENSEESVTITEQQAIRESLFMLQGLPTALYRRSESTIVPRDKFSLAHLSSEALFHVLCAFGKIGRLVENVRNWLKLPQKLHYLQTMSAGLQEHISDFDAAISGMQNQFINPKETIAISLLKILSWSEEKAEVLTTIDQLISRMSSSQKNHLHNLDVLFDQICLSESSNDQRNRAVMKILSVSWETYVRPIKKWITKGELDPNLDPFFVQIGNSDNLSRLWSERVLLNNELEGHSAPIFMQPFVQKIFSCGKTVLFLRTLTKNQCDSEVVELRISLPGFGYQETTLSDTLPFRELWSTSMDTALSSSLRQASQLLLDELGERCKLWAALDTLEHVYFAKSGPLTESVDSKIFSRIDQCDSSWNDRFLIADLLEDKFSNAEGVEMDRLVVHSRHTTSRSMESRRQSVKILEELSVEYVLPWQLANIISQSALGSYRRVALLLAQIRRAKYVLLRRAHFFVQNGLLHLDAGNRKVAQALHYRLLTFVDILYNHLTSLVIEKATARIREELKASIDVDLMIAGFDTYTACLEDACLTAKKLRVVRDAVIAELDLCIRFSDVVSTPAPSERRGSDFEASSFISAQSRSRGREGSNAAEDISDEDNDPEEDEDQGEGYSSFVVLENGSPVEEIKKIQGQFERYLGFVVAGLRGLAKNGTQGSSWEVLAERLDWKKRTVG